MIVHEHFFSLAAECAKKATCERDLCGAVVVKNGIVIGEGWNSPAGSREDQRMCMVEMYDWMKKKKADKTCCMHAEWRAIMDALKNHSDEITGSMLYFTRVDAEGNILKSGEPYCTVCSRLALDSGVAQFVLWRESGIRAFATDEYNQISYASHQ